MYVWFFGRWFFLFGHWKIFKRTQNNEITLSIVVLVLKWIYCQNCTVLFAFFFVWLQAGLAWTLAARVQTIPDDKTIAARRVPIAAKMRDVASGVNDTILNLGAKTIIPPFVGASQLFAALPPWAPRSSILKIKITNAHKAGHHRIVNTFSDDLVLSCLCKKWQLRSCYPGFSGVFKVTIHLYSPLCNLSF